MSTQYVTSECVNSKMQLHCTTQKELNRIRTHTIHSIHVCSDVCFYNRIDYHDVCIMIQVIMIVNPDDDNIQNLLMLCK